MSLNFIFCYSNAQNQNHIQATAELLEECPFVACVSALEAT